VLRHPPVRIKDSPYSQKILEGEVWQSSKIQKYFTLAQSWSKCTTSLSYGPVFDLATWHDTSRPLLSLPSSTKSLIRW
jgi:hypothetical protein